MNEVPRGGARPPIHLLATESDMVGNLALQIEDRQPVVAAMLFDEIDRAELHDPDTLPPGVITLGSEVDFLDEKNHRLTTVRLVMPAAANIALGRISILTPMGVGLYGLSAGQSIDWPDRDGRERRIRILAVRPPQPVTAH